MSKKSKESKPSNKQKVKGYNLYQSVISNLSGKMRLTGTPQSKEIRVVSQFINSMDESDVSNMAMEHLWRKNGNQTLFPESASLLQALYKSTYSIDKVVELEFPLDTFSVAVPKGVKMLESGMDVPSFLVDNISPRNELTRDLDYKIKHILKHSDITKTELSDLKKGLEENISEWDPLKIDEKRLIIVFVNPETKARNRQMIDPTSLSIMLKSKDFNDYEKRLAKTTSTSSGYMSDSSKKIMFFVTKMVATLSVYLSATKESKQDKLLNGLPGIHVKDIEKQSNLDKLTQNFLIKSTDAIELASKAVGNDVKAHYREFHFRNLQHERFYQGEHENKKQGSRWVWVSDSVVNENVKAKTLHDDGLSL
jgi:hypothetical protein